MSNRTTPEHIVELGPNEVFVFGSNMLGEHMGGAARTAYEKFGAEWGKPEGLQGQSYALPTVGKPDWSRNWQEVAFATCDDAVDDGLPRLVDGVPYSRAKWRKDSLKAYGNGIVPEVAIQIMKAIKESVPDISA